MSDPRSSRRIRFVLAMLSVCGLAALAWASFMPPDARVVYNASDSVPVGWYRIDPPGRRPDSLPVGSIVLIRLPDTVAAFAAQRGYLPTGIPLLKRVGAVAPQEVCVTERGVRIDGVPVAAALPADRLGRPLQAWPGCRRLRPGELFLLGTTSPTSFDSRYFGPAGASAVLGVAHPLWLETSQ
ncbi:S26 family signal peptidase [Pseudomonas aeruginosa]|uniref:S26 family signal peptidase n=1 Tax=Pseudomonas aeruginosa TaxID=287 RepID=UPI002E1D4B21|nr:S26 family signal peptidase [Pseudomonas aeruginosa]MED5024771.1 S26 family signal peptidase [Pseudomonas aeruginosa]